MNKINAETILMADFYRLSNEFNQKMCEWEMNSDPQAGKAANCLFVQLIALLSAIKDLKEIQFIVDKYSPYLPNYRQDK